MSAETFKDGDPGEIYSKMPTMEALKHFRKFRDQWSGKPHTRSNHNDVLKRLERLASKGLQPHGPDPLQSAKVETIRVEAPYHPCAMRLTELKPVLMSELGLNTHHRGRVLLAKLVGVVDTTWTNTLATIEDLSGDVELLKLHFVCMDKQPGNSWPKVGSWLAIKDPFFTLDEIYITECIRVDHPSDLICAENWPTNFFRQVGLHKTFSDEIERTPLEWKEAGSSALAAKDFDVAHTSYTRGIRAVTAKPGTFGHSIEKDIRRNRSHVRLALGRYEGALTDAIGALTHLSDENHKNLDAKAYFRAARASYGLKQYKKAVLLLCDQLELCPDDRDAVSLPKRTQDRLREERHGSYDLANIQKSLSREPRVDAANFIINTTIKPSWPKRGRGLFATCDLQPGELIMAETSFCCVESSEDTNLCALGYNASTPDEANPSFIGLWRSAVNEAGKNPEKGSDLMRLHCDYKGTGAHVSEVDGAAVVDTFKVHDIVRCNSFGISPFIRPVEELDDEDLVDRSSAMWIRLSYANHSCVPNAQKISYGHLVLVHAIQPIAEGEEITLSYPDDWKDLEAHKKRMRTDWGFQCECQLCEADAKCAPDNLAERSRLYKESMLRFRITPLARRENLSMIPQCEHHVEDIDRTYSNISVCWPSQDPSDPGAKMAPRSLHRRSGSP
jgi:tetratricopeptide (TPR) repeat protein